MKTILVSGSSSGIGFAICEESKKQGYNVIGISRNINSRATELGIRSYSVDVTNQNQINELVNNLTSENITIDILINNAGLLIKDKFRDTTDDAFKKVYDVNIFGLATVSYTHLTLPTKRIV